MQSLSMDIESILIKGTRNVHWQSLATLLIFSNVTRQSLDSSLTILYIYPQAHGAIIVAFHLEVFTVLLFVFFQKKALIG